MSRRFVVAAALVVTVAATVVAAAALAPPACAAPAATAVPLRGAGDVVGGDGLVYRWYAGYGYRFQPLLSFGRLNTLVSSQRPRDARRLAAALVARAGRRRAALTWEYDFPYGGPVPWTSGFVQAVAAQALARTGVLLGEAQLLHAADGAFAALRPGLVLRLGGGLWIREYGFSDTAILNAQLQSLVSLEVYARLSGRADAQATVRQLYVAARTLLPRFDLGCWSRYALGGAAATTHYHAYHVDLLGRLADRHPDDAAWRSTHDDWSRCL